MAALMTFQDSRVKTQVSGLSFIGLYFCCVALGALAGVTKTPLSERHNKWLNQEVVYIIADEERSEFLGLQSDEQRDVFVEQFWARRDPDPSSQENEFRRRHSARIQFANNHYHDGKPGWKTARGRIYIMHGPPDDVSIIYGGRPLVVDVQRPTEVLTGDSNPDRQRHYRISFTTPEAEIWLYRHLPGARNFTSRFEIIFARIDPSRLYTLNQIMRQVASGLNLSYQQRLERDYALMNFFRGQMLGGEFRILYAGEYRFHDVDEFYQSVFHPRRLPTISMTDFQVGLSDVERSPGEMIVEKLKLRQELRERVASQTYFRELRLQVDFGFMRAESGYTLMPFTLCFGSVRDFSGAAISTTDSRTIDLLAELATPAGQVVAQWADRIQSKRSRINRITHPDQDIYQARLSARPGPYRFRIYALEQARGAAATWSGDVVLPNYSGSDLTISDVMLFSDVLKRGNWKDSEAGASPLGSLMEGGSEPFALWDYVLFPAIGREFRRKQNLTVFLEVYNPSLRQEDKKPTLRLRCRFLQDGRVVSEVPEKQLNYLTQSTASKTTYGLSIPLKTFTVGQYELQLEVIDEAQNRSIARATRFTIF